MIAEWAKEMARLDAEGIKAKRFAEYGLYCLKEYRAGWEACEKGVAPGPYESDHYQQGWSDCYETEEALTGKQLEWEKANGIND